MPSAESDALRVKFTSMSDRLAANPNIDLLTMRSMMEELGEQSSEPEGVIYSEVHSGGVRGIWCTPVDAAPENVILYMHGGGFVCCSPSSHRKLAGHLAKAAKSRAFVLDFRRAPEQPFPAQIDDGLAAIAWLRAQGIEAKQIVTAGDSAGGNLAVSLVLKLRDLGEELPAGIVTFSPWTDMEALGETLDTNAQTDVFNNRSVVEDMAKMYLGEDGSPTDPLANPLHADLAGLSPLFVTAGGAETLLDDSRRLVARAREAMVPVEFAIEPGQQHVYQYMVGRAPEATESVHAAGLWASAQFAANQSGGR